MKNANLAAATCHLASDRLNAAADAICLTPGYWLTAQELRGLARSIRDAGCTPEHEHLVAAAEALVGGVG